MTDDFFADLVPIKPKAGPQIPENNGLTHQRFSSSQDASLTGSEYGKPSQTTEVADLLGHEALGDSLPQQEAPGGRVDVRSTARDSQVQVKEFQDAVEATMRRFATGLQRVLEDINRRLENLETQTGELSAAVGEARNLDALREDAFQEKLTTVHKGMRDIGRAVQLVRDKQELLEAQAELAKLSAVKKAQEIPAAAPASAPKPADPSPASAETLTPAPSIASHASTELPKPAAAAAAVQTLPQPTVPPMPTHVTTAPPNPQVVATAQVPPQQQQQQYSAPALSHQPQYSQAPTQLEQPVQHQLNFSALPAATQTIAQGYPQQQQPQPQQHQQQQPPPAQQYNTSAPAQQYSVPPPPKAFSAPPPTSFQASSPQYGGPPGASQQGYGGPSQASPQSGYSSGYPNLPHSQPSLPNGPPPQRYSSGGAPPPPPSSGSGYGSQSYGPPPPRNNGSYREPSAYGGGQAGNRPPPPSGQTASRNIPLEQVIDDVANMGFSRHDVRAVVSELMDRGQAVDLNIVLDRLMNGPRR